MSPSEHNAGNDKIGSLVDEFIDSVTKNAQKQSLVAEHDVTLAMARLIDRYNALTDRPSAYTTDQSPTDTKAQEEEDLQVLRSFIDTTGQVPKGGLGAPRDMPWETFSMKTYETEVNTDEGPVAKQRTVLCHDRVDLHVLQDSNGRKAADSCSGLIFSYIPSAKDEQAGLSGWHVHLIQQNRPRVSAAGDEISASVEGPAGLNRWDQKTRAGKLPTDTEADTFLNEVVEEAGNRRDLTVVLRAKGAKDSGMTSAVEASFIALDPTHQASNTAAQKLEQDEIDNGLVSHDRSWPVEVVIEAIQRGLPKGCMFSSAVANTLTGWGAEKALNAARDTLVTEARASHAHFEPTEM